LVNHFNPPKLGLGFGVGFPGVCSNYLNFPGFFKVIRADPRVAIFSSVCGVCSNYLKKPREIKVIRADPWKMQEKPYLQQQQHHPSIQKERISIARNLFS